MWNGFISLLHNVCVPTPMDADADVDSDGDRGETLSNISWATKTTTTMVMVMLMTMSTTQYSILHQHSTISMLHTDSLHAFHHTFDKPIHIYLRPKAIWTISAAADDDNEANARTKKLDKMLRTIILHNDNNNNNNVMIRNKIINVWEWVRVCLYGNWCDIHLA